MPSPPPSATKRARVLAVVTAVYWLLLFTATHVPVPGSWAPGGDRQTIFDKVEHTVAFAGLALLLAATGAAFQQPLLRLIPAVLTAIGVYGAVDELTQQFVPTRSPDVLDWFADMLGASLGILAFLLIRLVVRSGAEPAKSDCSVDASSKLSRSASDVAVIR